MRSVQDIVFGITGQLVYFDAPEGRPTSVTSVEVFGWDTSDDGFAEGAVGAASVETDPNTTIDADSGCGQSDPRVLNVTATTGAVIDRTYLVTGTDGFKEWFDCAEINSGNYLVARHPLHNAYVAADTVQSTRIQATIDSTWIADTANVREDAGPNPHYRVRWIYVVGGKTHVADTYFNVVRYAGAHGVRPQDIEAMSPGWIDRLPTDHYRNQGRGLIDDAYRAVKIDLHQIDLASSSIAESEIVDELTRYKTIELGELARFMNGDSDSSRVEMATKRYTARLDSLLRISARVPVRDTAGAATPIIAVGLTRR